MDRYVINFILDSESYIVFCDTQSEVAMIVAKAENVGYKLDSVDKLFNVYDLPEFLKLLEPPIGTDLLFGDKL